MHASFFAGLGMLELKRRNRWIRATRIRSLLQPVCALWTATGGWCRYCHALNTNLKAALHAACASVLHALKSLLLLSRPWFAVCCRCLCAGCCSPMRPRCCWLHRTRPCLCCQPSVSCWLRLTCASRARHTWMRACVYCRRQQAAVRKSLPHPSH